MASRSWFQPTPGRTCAHVGAPTPVPSLQGVSGRMQGLRCHRRCQPDPQRGLAEGGTRMPRRFAIRGIAAVLMAIGLLSSAGSSPAWAGVYVKDLYLKIGYEHQIDSRTCTAAGTAMMLNFIARRDLRLDQAYILRWSRRATRWMIGRSVARTRSAGRGRSPTSRRGPGAGPFRTAGSPTAARPPRSSTRPA